MKRSVRQSNHIQSDDDNEDTWLRGGLTAANKKRLEFNNDEVARELEVGHDDDDDDGVCDDADDDNCLQDMIDILSKASCEEPSSDSTIMKFVMNLRSSKMLIIIIIMMIIIICISVGMQCEQIQSRCSSSSGQQCHKM